jgi:hypothetical protein
MSGHNKSKKGQMRYVSSKRHEKNKARRIARHEAMVAESRARRAA